MDYRTWIFPLVALVLASAAYGCKTVSCPAGTKSVEGQCTSTSEDSTLAGDAGGTNGATPSGGADGINTGNAGKSGDPAGAEAANGGMTGSGAAASGAGASGAAASGGAGSGAAASGGAAANGAAGTGGAGSGGNSSMMNASMCGAETCNNQDDDCDQKVDEELTRPCGAPMAMGICKPGTETCMNGQWSGMCVGAVEAGMEMCDAEGLDENCNGTANEGCACTPGMMKACGNDRGSCMLGSQTCDDKGQWSAECVGAVGPKTETCDGVNDENCDGKLDEGCECTNGKTMNCGSDAGECAAGQKTCVDGKWGATCEGERKPGTEACDGAKDEDCDGQVDEDCQCTNGERMECGSDVGECGKGSKVCANGKWGSTCEGERKPGIEDCDGKDDDCDGRMDEGVQNACGGCMRLANPPKASCSAGQFGCRVTGTYECAANKESTTCPVRALTPTEEKCGGGDEDCDGRMDEGLDNDCGGSCRNVLPGVPNDPCGSADSCTGFRPRWQCVGTNLVCRPCTYLCASGDGTLEEESTDPCGWVANELHQGPDGTIGTCVPKDRNCL